MGSVAGALKVNPKHQAELQSQDRHQYRGYSQRANDFFAFKLALLTVSQLKERNHPTNASKLRPSLTPRHRVFSPEQGWPELMLSGHLQPNQQL
jgi:hypothetical protein